MKRIVSAFVVGLVGVACAAGTEAQATTSASSEALRFRLGANLDFVDGLKANDVYYEFGWRSRNARSVGKKPLHLFLGFNQLRGFASPIDSNPSPEQAQTRDTIRTSAGLDSLFVGTTSVFNRENGAPSVVNVTAQAGVEVWGGVAVSIRGDIRRREQQSDFSARGEVLIRRPDGTEVSRDSLPEFNAALTTEGYENFIGVGPTIWIEQPTFGVIGGVILGQRWTEERSASSNPIRQRAPELGRSDRVLKDRSWGYVLYLSFEETEHIGFQLGWEMRDRLFGPRDFYLHLSKSIPLEALGDLLRPLGA